MRKVLIQGTGVSYQKRAVAKVEHGVRWIPLGEDAIQTAERPWSLNACGPRFPRRRRPLPAKLHLSDGSGVGASVADRWRLLCEIRLAADDVEHSDQRERNQNRDFPMRPTLSSGPDLDFAGKQGSNPEKAPLSSIPRTGGTAGWRACETASSPLHSDRAPD